jgi:hypothetical protein
MTDFRWLMYVGQYDMVFRHIKRSANVVGDGISRQFLDKEGEVYFDPQQALLLRPNRELEAEMDRVLALTQGILGLHDEPPTRHGSVAERGTLGGYMLGNGPIKCSCEEREYREEEQSNVFLSFGRVWPMMYEVQGWCMRNCRITELGGK